MTQREIQHLYWRAGFGILPKQLRQLNNKSRVEIVKDLFDKSEKVTPLEIEIPELKHLDFKTIQKDKEALKKLVKVLQDRLVDYNEAWIQRLNNPKELLRESMTLF